MPGLIPGRAGREGLCLGEEDNNGNVAAHSHSQQQLFRIFPEESREGSLEGIWEESINLTLTS